MIRLSARARSGAGLLGLLCLVLGPAAWAQSGNARCAANGTQLTFSEGIAAGQIVLAAKGKAKAKGRPVPDPALRDTENVPLGEGIDSYFEREVLPHAPDAWIDRDKTKVGYEIPFNRHFYVFNPPRPLSEIDAELKVVTDRIVAVVGGLTA